MSNPFEKGTLTIEQADRKVRDMSNSLLEMYASWETDMTQAWVNRDDEQRLARRAINEISRRQRLAAQQAEKDAEQAKRQAARDKEAAAEIENFKARARAAFPGTERQWQEQWPAIRAEWQRKRAIEGVSDLDRLIAQKRAEMSL